MVKERLHFEHRLVGIMIAMYCRHAHRVRETCPECNRLITYANRRIERCRFGEKKPVCSRCAVQCYNQTMRQAIRRVMRFAGPRMLFRHPVLALRHLWHTIRFPVFLRGPKKI